MHRIKCKAFAKINLTLDILGKRPDGYHEILTLYQGISLHDVVEIIPINFADIVLTSDLPGLPTGKENLAFQAAQLLKERYPQIIGGVKITLNKRIPLAAGLGGGSADAAAVLWGMNKLYDLHLSEEELRKLGTRLGSDVPFCITPLTAIGRGRGEQLTACSPCPELWLVLLKPPFGVSTKEVYTNLANVKIKKRPPLTEILEGLRMADKEKIYAAMGNVLEDSTYVLYPQLKDWAQAIALLDGVKKVMMAGSGPTLMAFVNSRKEAEKLASSWGKPNWSVEIVRTITDVDLTGRMIIDE